MIQKIRTVKLPGNCPETACILPSNCLKKAVSESDTAFLLPLHIIRYFCVGPPPDLGKAVHTDVE